MPLYVFIRAAKTTAKSKMYSQGEITITDSITLLFRISLGDRMSITSFWLSELLSISRAQKKEIGKVSDTFLR
jgi:hypothetical protein